MPNSTNEVILNGQVIMSTRGNTVTEDTLVQGEVAQDKTGKDITGKLDPVSHEELNELKERVDALDREAYIISDDEGEIVEGDYIPFNDSSDVTKPKKKIMFSGFIEKLRSFFASKTGDNITNKDTFRQNIHTLEWLGTNIPDNSDLDTYTTAGNYRVVSDASGGTIAHLPLALCGKVIVFDNGNGGIEQFYLANHSPRIFVRTKFGNDAWSNWIEIGNGDGSKVHSYETGKSIPANSDLNNYKTTGVYSVNTDTDAPTITNIPEQVGGKLIVSNIVPSSNFIHQFYFSDTNHIYVRMYSNWNTSWSAWKEIGEGGDSKPHTYEMGTEIPANSDIDDYKTEGVYYVSGGDTAGTMSNLPVGKAGKLIVMDRDNGARLFQIYMISRDEIYMRDMDNNGVFSVWSNIRSPHTYELGTSIPANSDLNNYKAGGVYYIQLDTTASNISNVPVAKAGKLIVAKTTSANNYLLQTYYVNASTEIYARWYNPSSDSWSAWENLSRSHSFELGTAIPANSDLNNYVSDGVYYIQLDATASTISNVPVEKAGKLVVYTILSSNYLCQIYTTYLGDVYIRRYVSSLSPAWSAWKQLATIDAISPSTVGDGYAVATVSGSAITATISGFQLRAGVIVAIKIEGEILTACTLNISSTGAKPIKFWNNEDPTYGKPIGLGCINTMIYDGTYYRIISLDRTPSVRVQNYVADTSGNELIEWGYGTNRAAIKHNIGTNKLTWNYYKNSAWRGDVILADYNDLGASVAKVGKNILPSWGYTTNVRTHNGITFTFNPSTGEITANGTATADANCILAGNNTTYGYRIPKGSYVLSGCPSGGANNKYFISLQYHDSEFHAQLDYGNGTSFTLNNDVYCKISDNENYYILIRSGQTVSNIVFKPMLRPAFTTADYEPCEDISKGNCYVGRCETAGATKDKVAYVDGYFVLRKGVRIAIKFSNTNTYSNATASPVTLNVNNTGAKNIWYWQTHSGAGNTGTNTIIYGYANRYVYYVYDGTYWVWDGMSGDVNDNQRKSFYGTCSTAGDQQVKVVTLADATGWELRAGTIVGVKFSNSNTYNATTDNKVQLNVNGTGAKNIYYNTGYPTGTNGTAFGVANRVHYYMYNGTDWCWMNHGLDVDTADPRVLGFGYAICETAEATTAKVATLASYTLRNGGYVSVKFINKVPADSTLNINSRGAKEMWYHGVKVTANIILGGDIATFVYDGTRYQLVGIDRCANYNDMIYKSYNGIATIKNAGVQTLEEITLGAGVWMVTWREQCACSALTNIAFSLSATKKTSGGQFSIQDGYYGSFSRTGVLEAFTCSFPVRLNTTMKLYAQHFVGGSTALTTAFGYLNITRIS